MTDTTIAGIRTLIPLIVGAIVGWLTARGVTVDDSTRNTIEVLVTAASAFAYWLIVQMLSRVWPQAQALLGVARAPTYGSPVAATPDDADPLADLDPDTVDPVDDEDGPPSEWLADVLAHPSADSPATEPKVVERDPDDDGKAAGE